METPRFPSPTDDQPDLRSTLLGYLDYFRGVVIARVGDLDEATARRSCLPSGWSPLELAHHLAYVEMRWLDWGFEGRTVQDPWGDRYGDRWRVPDRLDVASTMAILRERARVTRAVVEAHDMDERGAPGERWDGAEPAPLERVLLHLLQEYARHAGHLDIVRELLDGQTGE